MKLKQEKIDLIMAELESLYPDAKAELDFTNPFELLIATILSAQCTDIRVNQVTKKLFLIAPNAESLAELSLAELERIIKPCGLYKTKAAHIHDTSKQIVELWEGRVPNTIENLLTLPGVGKKTANVVVSNAFGIPAIAVDTHVFRVSNRLGIVKAKTVEETEKQLMSCIAREKWSKSHHLLIFHGRRTCKARNPACQNCTLSGLCVYYKALKLQDS